MRKTTEERIREFREMGIEFLEEPPEGWHRVDGATTAPNGWEWWAYGSLFSHSHRHALVRKK